VESTKQYLIPAGVAALLVGAAFGMGQRAGSQAANTKAVDQLEDKVATLERRVSDHAADLRVLRLRIKNMEDGDDASGQPTSIQ
jgi:hypothetical protein